MKAAVVQAAGETPKYIDFNNPAREAGKEVITVSAAALTNLTKSRASGAHYSAGGAYPAVVGVDGVGTTQDGRRVYFILPEAPHGAMAEMTIVRAEQCVALPSGIDNITAAAIANPGMSAWAAFAERAHLKAGETVLINGATGTAGRLAVQIAKYMGAARLIATGRDEQALEELKSLGADVTIPFKLDGANPNGSEAFETALKQEFSRGIDVVIDYLWGESAATIITAIAKAVEEASPVRFVQVGSISGNEIQLPGAALRSSSIVLMGSGIKSVSMSGLLAAISSVFQAIGPANLKIATKAVPLAQVDEAWTDQSKTRVVFVIG